MPFVPDAAVLPQLQRKGHKIRAMLHKNLEFAQVELFYAWHYLLSDHESPDEDPDGSNNQDDGSSERGGP